MLPLAYVLSNREKRLAPVSVQADPRSARIARRSPAKHRHYRCQRIALVRRRGWKALGVRIQKMLRKNKKFGITRRIDAKKPKLGGAETGFQHGHPVTPPPPVLLAASTG